MLKYGIMAKAVEMMCFKSSLERLSEIYSDMDMKAHKNKKCTLFTDKAQDKKVKESMASQNSPYKLDWKFRYEKGVDEFYNTYTECGICKLGKWKTALSLFPVSVIWMKEITGMKEENSTEPKHWRRETTAATFV